MAKVNRTTNKVKSTGRLSRFSAKLKSNKKMSVALSVLLIAIVGGTYVRFSSAATGYTWTGNSISIDYQGTYTKKQDGRIAVQSIGNPQGKQVLAVYIRSSVSNNDTYCFSGKTAKALESYVIAYSYGDVRYPYGWTKVAVGGSLNPGNKLIPAGDFFICGKVPGRPSTAYPGQPRNIHFYTEAPRDGVHAVYQAGRAGY